MGVPNTSTFLQSDVKTEIGTTDNLLSELFSLSNDAGFDPLYKGSKDRLGNFRNYSHIVTTAFLMYTSSYTNSADACLSDAIYTTLYHNGPSTLPQIGDDIFIDVLGTMPFNGGSNYFKISSGGTFRSIRINSTGVALTNSVAC